MAKRSGKSSARSPAAAAGSGRGDPDWPRVLVTGGAGFIGSHTVVALREACFEPVIVDDFRNSEPAVLDRLEELTGTRFRHFAVDCGDARKMRQVVEKCGPFAGIIHFAAAKSVSESVRDPLKYYRDNLGSMVTVLDLARSQGIRSFVFSSSCTVYGEPDTLPVTEETPTRPAESPYGFSKQASEQMIRDAVRAGFPVDFVTLRYFNPIGAHPSGKIGELPLGVPENLVPYITQTAAGLRPELTVFGNDYPTPDGSCIRDYIHVMDLAEAHVAALFWVRRERGNGPGSNEVFNVGTGKGVSVLEAIAAFERASGKPLAYRIGARRPGDIVKIWAGVGKAQSTLGWRAKRSLDESMRDAWNWQQGLAGRSPTASSRKAR